MKDLPGDPHLILRISTQFFGLTPSSQMVTLLHETIRMSLDLTGKPSNRPTIYPRVISKARRGPSRRLRPNASSLGEVCICSPTRSWPRNTYSKTTQHLLLTESAITTTSKSGPRRTVTTQSQSLVSSGQSPSGFGSATNWGLSSPQRTNWGPPSVTALPFSTPDFVTCYRAINIAA